MEQLNKKIAYSINQLEHWINKNGWTGFDPYDIKEPAVIRTITKLGNKNFFFEIAREALFELFLMFPRISRKLLFIKPRVNAKAMGLFAQSYLDMFINTQKERYMEKAKECLVWLDNNYSNEFNGKGWGYPFTWQAKEKIPANTPNGIVTTAVGNAYFKMFKLTSNNKYLQTCTEICEFLVNLPIDYINNDQICFSYTPIFVNHVHNLNLFVAEFLIKVGKEINNKKYIELGLKATNYTVFNQDDDGSFDYDGPPEKLKNFKDNYHTAFVLTQLYSIWNLTSEQIYWDSLKKCYDHYINNFFLDKRVPKFTPNRLYKIDIHSCASSIHCLSELAEHFPEGISIAKNVAEWTIENLQDKDGYFYHGIFQSRILKTKFISKIPYMRWGQAWMLRGLSSLIHKSS